uniref:Putative glutelin type-A 3 n=1 Tax=Davidia involucrata TaxID=16924 RepID=A0A5B7ACU3_DAVIN
MASKLSVPQVANEKIFDGDGGSYYSWSSSKTPLLSVAKVGAGRLMLQPWGFALPHYADSSKISYVLQGSCMVGMVFPTSSEEKTLMIKKGDVIPIPIGVVSWWFNGGDSDVVIVFLGETSKAHTPGSFTYFFLTGTLGMLKGFSTEFISRACNMKEDEANKLVKSQTGALIVKLAETLDMPRQCNGTSTDGMIFNLDNALPDIDVKNGGSLTIVTEAKLAWLGKIGLSANLVKLDANAMCSPMYTTGSEAQLTYIVRGSGRVQVVGINGERVLETKVQAGHMFVVPKFFAVATIADAEGMEFFSVITSSQPVFGQLAGNTSVWKALSPAVLQASLNVPQEFAELFSLKIKESTILIPPKK